MSAISTAKLEIIDDGKYLLVEDYSYEWEKDGHKFRLTIPAPFITDIASVPQPLWSLGFTPDGRQRDAALFHDFIYHHKGKLPKGSYQIEKSRTVQSGPNAMVKASWELKEWVDVNTRWSRKEADRLFARILREDGVGSVKRKLMYQAVRWFGGYAWAD